MRGVLGVQLWLRYHDGGSCLSTVRVLGSQGCGNVLYRRRHSCAAIFDRCPLLFSRLLVRLAKLAQDAQARGEQTAPRSSEPLTTNTVERERAHAPQTFYVKTSHVRRSWVGTRAGVTRKGGGGIGNTPSALGALELQQCDEGRSPRAIGTATVARADHEFIKRVPPQRDRVDSAAVNPQAHRHVGPGDRSTERDWCLRREWDVRAEKCSRFGRAGRGNRK